MVGEKPTTILVVEDDCDLREMLEEFLATLPVSLDVCSAESYFQAMDGIEKGDVSPDIAVWDLGEMVRRDIVAEITKVTRRRLMLIVISGSNYGDVVLLPCGTDVQMVYLSKPFRLAIFKRLIDVGLAFVLNGTRVTSSSELPVAACLIGGQKVQHLGEPSTFDLSARDFLNYVEGVILDDTTEIAFASPEIGKRWFSVLKKFFSKIGDSENADVEFLKRFTNSKIGLFLVRTAGMREFGNFVMADFLHDLRNALSAFDEGLSDGDTDVAQRRKERKRKKLVAFVGEQIGILKQGFEVGGFHEDVDVKAFFERFQYLEGTHNRVVVNVPEGVTVKVPTGWLHSVLRNFVVNFQRGCEEKFWQCGTPASRPRNSWMDIDISFDGQNVVIKIADNIAPFPDDKLDALFDSRIVANGDDLSSGSGKGLLSMAKVLRRLNGYVSLTQRSGKRGYVNIKDIYVGSKSRINDGTLLPKGATKQFEIRLKADRLEP
ncbi:MAG: hypothetical protein UV80_C0003G0076 [Candidatus Peregrinibacteria bacterium GW2011_GWF2_43_17]|nr:MAG: hypothetical protein UV80_C0003G0076 [Candidatus Peregrinibacteria bacterium GW2011_GWF2_43_17]KKT19750.1 MAG: hypothetical protein UW03_C0014G0012 [Candidatus Peregrinibacteria bacterium GW2011_GWA2_43_8]HAU40213.1 hypothetical protein [Candidatus Peregrinibacteria bacterium]